MSKNVRTIRIEVEVACDDQAEIDTAIRAVERFTYRTSLVNVIHEATKTPDGFPGKLEVVRTVVSDHGGGLA